MAFGAAKRGGETRNAFGVHQGRIGGRYFLGQNDAALGRIGEGVVILLQQAADQAIADFADIFSTRREIGVVHRRKTCLRRANLSLNRSFGIDALLGDNFLDSAHQARTRQHALIGIEQQHHIFRTRRQAFGLLLHLAKCRCVLAMRAMQAL